MLKHSPAKRVISFFIITAFIIPEMLFATSIRLLWNENKESDLLGYRIYYGTTPGNYDHFVDVYNATRHNLSGLDEDAKYHLAITAYDTQYEESTLSPKITTKNVFFGFIIFSDPPFLLSIFPSFNFIKTEENFSLFNQDAPLNQVGKFDQEGNRYSAYCKYEIKQSDGIIRYYWTFDRKGNISTDFFISGNITTEIESSNGASYASGFFLAFRNLLAH